jgi:hypothetical protein
MRRPRHPKRGCLAIEREKERKKKGWKTVHKTPTK